MLPRRNRIVRPEDFRLTMRRGAKTVGGDIVVYRHNTTGARVGIIVSTKCGGAVVRNTLRRQTRAIARSLIHEGQLTGDIVIRFRCTGAIPSFGELSDQLHHCLDIS